MLQASGEFALPRAEDMYLKSLATEALSERRDMCGEPTAMRSRELQHFQAPCRLRFAP
jgi:hypothetical protein